MTTQQIARTVNDVDVGQLAESIAAIRKQPKLSKFVFRARNRWLKGGHNRATVNEYRGVCEDHARTQSFVFDLDEPPVLLGEDRGANPVEALLAALSGCLTTSLVYHAAARGIELTRVESTYEGDLDIQGFLGLNDHVRNGYEKIRITFRVEGNASEKELDELVRVAQERSPVYDIVTNRTPVEVVRAK